MGLIQLIVILAVLGFALYMVLTYVPMPQPVKTVIVGIAVLALVVLILQAIGVDSGLGRVRL
jgi:hypothetical protein